MIWEVDPLACPKCGKAMKIVAIVQDKGLVETALKSIGLWQELEPRGPPVDLIADPNSEITREPWWDDWTANE
jgi:hypothetical protein